MKLDYFPVNGGDTVAVLGAHMGNEVIHYSEVVGFSGRVVAVEPNLRNFSVLMDRVKDKPNITPLNVAVWDRNCKLNLSIGTNTTNHSLVKNWGGKTEEVDALTWDSLMGKVGRVTLANVDVEGAENHFLRGMNINLPKHIILEVHTFFGVDRVEVARELTRKGYGIVNESQYIYATR